MRYFRIFFAFASLIGFIGFTFLNQGCKPRMKGKAGIRALSGQQGIEQLQRKRAELESQIFALTEYQEGQSLVQANQWQNLFAQLSPETKAKLGTPGQESVQTAFALNGNNEGADTDLGIDQALRDQKIELAQLEAELAAAEAAEDRYTKSMAAFGSASTCRISSIGSADTNGCMCVHRWQFENLTPTTKNFCKGSGKFGEFCGEGFAFEVPSLTEYRDFLALPKHQGSNEKSVIDPALIHFLERDFTYRGCRTLEGRVSTPGIKQQRAIGSEFKPVPVPLVLAANEQASTEPGCLSFRRRPTDNATSAEMFPGKEFWKTAQCAPLYEFRYGPQFRTSIIESEMERFAGVEPSLQPSARVYCAKDWVNLSASKAALKDNNGNSYGTMLRIGSTYSMFDVEFAGREGKESFKSLRAKAEASIQSRYLSDCQKAAQEKNQKARTGEMESIYEWECPGAALWKHTLSDKEATQVSADAKAIEKPIYCRFYDDLYEDVKQCEIRLGWNGGESCCKDVLTNRRRMSPDAVAAYCDAYPKEITFRGLAETEQRISCEDAYQNLLQSDNEANRGVFAACVKAQTQACDGYDRWKGMAEGDVKKRFMKEAQHECDTDLTRWNGALANTQKPSPQARIKNEKDSMLREVQLDRERFRQYKDWLRGIALNPSRDCRRVKPIGGIDSFLPCYEIFPYATAVPVSNLIYPCGAGGQERCFCYEDQTVPDICAGDADTQCVVAQETAESSSQPGPVVPVVAGSAPQSAAPALPKWFWQCNKTKTPCNCEASKDVRLWR